MRLAEMLDDDLQFIARHLDAKGVRARVEPLLCFGACAVWCCVSRILFVSGSRSLDRTTAARAWAIDILQRAFAWWRPALLVHGGCEDCPDTWADDIAYHDDIPTLVFLRDGTVVPSGEIPKCVTFRATRWTSEEHLLSHPPRRRPLMRNEEMVRVLSEEVGDAEVLCMGLGAPWSERHGTEHTVGLARASKKMRVEYRVCPAEFGPQGASQ